MEWTCYSNSIKYLKEEILADQPIRQIQCNLTGIYFGGKPE